MNIQERAAIEVMIKQRTGQGRKLLCLYCDHWPKDSGDAYRICSLHKKREHFQHLCIEFEHQDLGIPDPAPRPTRISKEDQTALVLMGKRCRDCSHYVPDNNKHLGWCAREGEVARPGEKLCLQFRPKEPK